MARILVGLTMYSRAGVCSTPRGLGGEGDCIVPGAMKAQTSPWAVQARGEGVQGGYSPLQLPG